MSLRRVQHHAGANYVAVEAALTYKHAALLCFLHDLRDRLRVWFLGFAILDQFERLHQAHTAHVANDRILLFQFFQSLTEVSADFRRVLFQIVVLDYFQYGEGGGARNRIAAESRKSETRKLIRHFRGRDRNTDWHTIAEAFRGSNDVGLDIPVLDAKPFFTSASPRGLHLIGDEKPSVFTRDLDCTLEISRRWNDKT